MSIPQHVSPLPPVFSEAFKRHRSVWTHKHSIMVLIFPSDPKERNQGIWAVLYNSFHVLQVPELIRQSCGIRGATHDSYAFIFYVSEEIPAIVRDQGKNVPPGDACSFGN